MPAPVLYSAQFDRPDLYQRGRDELLVCRTYRAGSIETPTEAGSTITILDGENDEVVSAAAVAVADGWATYALDGDDTADLQVSRDWKTRWRLLMPDGNVHTFETRAALCRSVPHPVVTERTIYARVPSLNPLDAACISKRTEYADAIDEAWTQIANRLIEDDRAIERILSPSAMREAHLTLVLALVFEDLATGQNAHLETAKSYRAQHEAAWGRLAPEVDEDDNGTIDGKRPARAPVFVG